MTFGWVDDIILSMVSSGLPTHSKRIAWQNVKFDPQNLNTWIKVVNVPLSEVAATLGIDGHNEQQGFLQLSVYAKTGTGTRESNAILDEINELFKVPFRLNAPTDCLLRLTSKMNSSGGQTSLADTTAGGIEGVWDSNYITIYWLARGPR